jgi:hypothetical protein
MKVILELESSYHVKENYSGSLFPVEFSMKVIVYTLLVSTKAFFMNNNDCIGMDEAGVDFDESEANGGNSSS